MTKYRTGNPDSPKLAASASPELRPSSWQARHARFNPGPPSMTKRQRRNRAHAEALIEDARRSRQTILGGYVGKRAGQ